jgi:hypothetical protein
MRDVRLAQEREHGVDEALYGVHRAPVGSPAWWARVVGAEQLERRVNQVDLHRWRG